MINKEEKNMKRRDGKGEERCERTRRNNSIANSHGVHNRGSILIHDGVNLYDTRTAPATWTLVYFMSYMNIYSTLAYKKHKKVPFNGPHALEGIRPCDGTRFGRHPAWWMTAPIALATAWRRSFHECLGCFLQKNKKKCTQQFYQLFVCIIVSAWQFLLPRLSPFVNSVAIKVS